MPDRPQEPLIQREVEAEVSWLMREFGISASGAVDQAQSRFDDVTPSTSLGLNGFERPGQSGVDAPAAARFKALKARK